MKRGARPGISALRGRGGCQEFLQWYREKKAGLHAALDRFRRQVDAAWAERPDGDRKTIALAWADLAGPVRAALFARLDGQAWDGPLWKALRPAGPTPTFQKDADV